jgi:EAL domain-containing protein (putative c-di-GMP-specific phosphodiesterase class I)
MSAPRPIPPDFTELRCRDCAHGSDLGFDFGMALQPIVRLSTREVFAHEALVRGPAPKSSATSTSATAIASTRAAA